MKEIDGRREMGFYGVLMANVNDTPPSLCLLLFNPTSFSLFFI